MQPPEIIKKSNDKRVSNLGYKKVFCKDGNEVVLLLSMDEETNFQKPTATSYGIARSVTVLAVYDMWGYKTDLKTANSHWDKNFVYEVGETYAPKNGIWYWPTFKQAQSYWLNAGEVKDERYEKLVKCRNN